MKYREIPKEIEAIRWTGKNEKAIRKFADAITTKTLNPILRTGYILYVSTKRGAISLRPNDYIIKTSDGSISPCKPEVFKKHYERVR